MRSARCHTGTVGNWTLCSGCWAEEAAFPLTIQSTQGCRTGHRCKGREIEDARDRRQPRRCTAVSCLASCLAFLLCCSVAHAQSVAFINPGKSDEIYWMTATQGMQAVARSLGMLRSAVRPARAAEDIRDRPRDGRARPWQKARLYRGHG